MCLASADGSLKSIVDEAGLSVSWRHLSVNINGTQALKPCSGHLHAGSMTAIMGASGAGKTTLLNALARRGPCDGDVRYGSKGEGWSKSLKRRVAFVEQEDVVFPGLTVREALNFSAELRLEATVSREERQKKVEELIGLLGLTRCADTRAGNAKIVEQRGISGGERKRLCIATELLTTPSLLCCDEPTSGLDSFMALVVIDRLRELTKRIGITVVCSIHQPNSQVFASFERLLLLDKGTLLYHGPAAEAADAFASLGHACPLGYNHPDWLIGTLVQGNLTETQQAELLQTYGVDSLPPFESEPPPPESEKVKSRYTASWGRQAGILFRRSWKVAKPSLWSTDLLMLYTLDAVLSGLTFYRIGYREEDIIKRLTAMFLLIIFWVFFPLMGSVALIPMEEVRLRKEITAGSFRLSAWFVTHTTLGMAPDFLWPLVFVPINYWMSGLSDNFFVFIGFFASIYLTISVSHSFGMLVSMLFPARAATVSIIFVTFFFLFTGVFVPLEDTPLPWAAYLNPVYYSINLAAAMVFTPGTSYEGGTISRDEALEMSSIKVSPWASLGALLGCLIFFRGGTYWLLRRKLERRLFVQRSDAKSPEPSVHTRVLKSARSSLSRLGASTSKGLQAVTEKKPPPERSAANEPHKEVV